MSNLYVSTVYYPDSMSSSTRAQSYRLDPPPAPVDLEELNETIQAVVTRWARGLQRRDEDAPEKEPW